jgi:filamentous hemagglutinin family protein
MATQTIVLSKNKLQYKEDTADYVKFDFTHNQITANAALLSATGMLTVAGKSNLSDKLTVLANGMDVTGASNLNGALTVTTGGMDVTGVSRITGNTVIDGNFTVSNMVDLQNNMQVQGNSDLGITKVRNTLTANGAVIVNNASTLNGTLTANGATTLNSTLNVTGASTLAGLTAGASTLDSLIVKSGGASTLNGALTVTGDSSLANLSANESTLAKLTVSGDSSLAKLTLTGDTYAKTVYVDGTHNVTGMTNLTGVLNVNSQHPVNFSGNLTVAENSKLNGGLEVTGNASVSGKLNVSGASGLSSIAHNFQVDGASTLAGLTVNGVSTLNGDLTANGALTAGASTLASLGVNGVALLNAGLSVTSGRSTFADTLTVNSGGLTVSLGDLALTQGNMALSQGGVTLTQGELKVIAGKTTLNALDVNGAMILTGSLNAGASRLASLEVIGTSTLNGATFSESSVLNATATTAANFNVLNANASILKSLEVTDASNLKGALTVDGTTTLKALQVNERASLNAGLGVAGNILANGNVDLDGVVTISQNLNVTGNAKIDKSLIINTGDLTVSVGQSTLGVLNAGGSTLGSLTVNDVSVLNNKLTILANGMDVTGASTIRGDLTVIQTAETDLRGTLKVGGTSTLGVLNGGQASLGATTLHSLEVTNASNLKGNLNVGADGAPVISNLFGDVTIKGNFNVIGTGKKTTLNQEELTVQDPTITIGNNNPADTVPMSLSMAYKTGDSAFTAGLRRKANNGGFLLFKNCVNHDDAKEAVIYDSLTVDTLECFSDMNLKKNIVTIDGALDKIDGIRGVYHDWINTKQSEDRQIGVIAQEVQAVYPELVHENENGYLSVNYPKLTAVLLQSIKELKAMVLAICAKQA